ncbi:hypothetical protein NO1_0185 [Candidatus Termititenax aidoneus]|uniref:Uncharacterized protein n=1 Tax=Termititenax aidoneus TaxID=2218524 RepID=A0A388TAH7_TERA1|nr:hypothetical protein NO1_0185 [Candidatus Termititenax aidoneus]
MRKMINKIFLLLAVLSALLSAEYTTANVLQQVAANVNSYKDLQADIKRYRARNLTDIPAAGTVATGSYYFTKHGISGNYMAVVTYNYGGELDVGKIVNGKIYDNEEDGDHYVEELQENIWTEIYPGFENYLFGLLEVTTLNELATDNYVVTAGVSVSANYEYAVLYISGNALTEIGYYVTGDLRARSIYLEYSSAGDDGDVYLKRTSYELGGGELDIIEYVQPRYEPIGNEANSFFPVADWPEEKEDEQDGENDEWLPGHNVKYEEGAELSPFAAYGVAGEEVPGHSGALQLSYTDLVLPGTNGLDFVLKRSYLSQQMNASPKPNSFRENPFRVSYPVDSAFFGQL